MSQEPQPPPSYSSHTLLDSAGWELRLCTCTEKHQKTARPEEATFGVAGICWHPPLMSWRSDPCEEGYLHLYSGRCLGRIALRWMVCILSRESVKRSRAPGAFLGLWSRRYKQWKRHLQSLANDAVLHNCHNGIRQRHIRALIKLFFQFQTHRRLWLVPKVTGQAPHKLAPCPLWKHWALPGRWMQKNVGAHSQAHEITSQRMCPFCVSRVRNRLSKAGYLQDPLSYL